MSAEGAMKEAIEYCLGQGILVRELGENSSEVFNMLLTEWNWDDAKEVWQEEAQEDGIVLGMAKGREEERKTILELMRQGYSPEQIESMLASRL
jgi:SOS response regulatory protein OraA/RecX